MNHLLDEHMKMYFHQFAPALVVFAIAGCQSKEPATESCQPPQTLIAQAPCESGYPGVLLIASDFESESSPFLFEVFPQEDTLSNNLSVRAYKNGADTRERFLVDAAVLKNAPKFIAQVSLNCQGKERKSAYFAFVKRTTSNPGCYVWAQQRL